VKSILQISFFSLLLATLLSVCVLAQSHQGQYMHIDYLNVNDENILTFIDKIATTFLPIQQARKQNEKISDWYVYRVAYPGSRNSYYNFVVITISDQISGFEDMDLQLNDQVASRERLRLLSEYRVHFTPNHSELWRIRNSIMQNEEAKPSRYIVMNYMNVGQGYEFEYQMMEDEVARPLHEMRMKRDMMRGWELNELIIPGGTEYGYNFSTLDHFEKLEHIEFGFTEELIRQTHPDTNINEFFDSINRARNLVRNEVWELIEAM
jgi:hypothetical protein